MWLVWLVYLMGSLCLFCVLFGNYCKGGSLFSAMCTLPSHMGGRYICQEVYIET